MKRFFEILKSGIAATTVMTAMMLIAPMMGMPKMPIGNMLAGFMGIPIFMGWIAHFMIGTAIAGGYILFFSKNLMSVGTLSGMIYSLVPFFMAQLVVMPMMGAGIFSMNTPLPMMMVMGSLIGHLVYGVTLGLFSKGSILSDIVSKNNDEDIVINHS